MARPRIEIDKNDFEKLCGLQCTQAEILDWFNVSDKTLNSWCKRTYSESFSEIYGKKKGKGKISLRRMQWKLAEHNATMAIFLGKQYLGQRDVIEERVEAGESTIEQIAKMIIGEKKDG